MMITAPLVLGLCLWAPPRDLVMPGYKKIEQQVAIENPGDFEGWVVVAATHFGPAHIKVVEPGVPFSYSSKYGTRVYGIPAGTPIPGSDSADKPPGSAFDGFPGAYPPVSQASEVAVLSPIDRALTTIRILNLDGSGLELEQVSTVVFDSEGRRIRWWRVWALPVGVVVGGVAGLVWLRRRRLKRASA